MIRASKLTKIFGSGENSVVALNEIDLDIFPGELVAIMGPSGSGKSTLMHCLAGLDLATSGEVYLGDQAISKLNDNELSLMRRHKVGFIFQSFNLLPMLSAKDNILLPLDIANVKVDEGWFDYLVDFLEVRERLDHKPTELSGGQQQRVAVARALIARPLVVFADEPTGNLDSKASSKLRELLKRSVSELSQTIILVTHDPKSASIAGRCIFLKDGMIIGQETGISEEQLITKLSEIY